MNRLPVDFNAEFFCGRTLNSIGYTKHQLYLSFSDEFLISAEGEVSVNDDRRLKLPESALYLYPLIDQKIISASGCADGTLSLVFEEGQILSVYDSNERYESYNVSERGKILVVV